MTKCLPLFFLLFFLTVSLFGQQDSSVWNLPKDVQILQTSNLHSFWAVGGKNTFLLHGNERKTDTLFLQKYLPKKFHIHSIQKYGDVIYFFDGFNDDIVLLNTQTLSKEIIHLDLKFNKQKYSIHPISSQKFLPYQQYFFAYVIPFSYDTVHTLYNTPMLYKQSKLIAVMEQKGKKAKIIDLIVERDPIYNDNVFAHVHDCFFEIDSTNQKLIVSQQMSPHLTLYDLKTKQIQLIKMPNQYENNNKNMPVTAQNYTTRRSLAASLYYHQFRRMYYSEETQTLYRCVKIGKTLPFSEEELSTPTQCNTQDAFNDTLYNLKSKQNWVIQKFHLEENKCTFISETPVHTIPNNSDFLLIKGDTLYFTGSMQGVKRLMTKYLL